MKNIEVKIKNGQYKELSEFKTFQGNLKEVTPARLQKLKNNIIKNGFYC